jgi:aminopeptidase N
VTVRLRTYFTTGLEDLADGYLASTADYLRHYDDRIGPYPYTEFSIVSSPTPSGFGMPALTYIGADVLKLPFIRATSLGHEVLHNWWGNGVYPDYGRGNWSEGLTTLMADYHYKERESAAAARDMRLGWLRDFAAVPEGEDQPLVAFTSRTHGTSQIVGYHKAAMTFAMLRDLIGAQAFDRGLREFWSARRFTVASWDDLRTAFEQASSQNLEWFFSQWLTRTGAPRLRIESAERQAIAGRWQVRVTLAQEGQSYRLRVPIRFETDQGDVVQFVDLVAARTTATFTLDRPSHAVVLDPELQVFRRLGPDEAPPILRDVMVNPATSAIVLSPDDAWTSAATGLLAKLLDGAPRIVDAGAQPTGAPLIVVGTAAEIEGYRAHRNFGSPPQVPAAGTARVWVERADGAATLFIAARDPAAVSALMRPLPHYGKQSWLVFDGAKAVERGVWPPIAPRRQLD